MDHPLSTRELEILQLRADGVKTDDIARRLGITPSTVGTFSERIRAKLHVEKTYAAVAIAIRAGWIR